MQQFASIELAKNIMSFHNNHSVLAGIQPPSCFYHSMKGRLPQTSLYQPRCLLYISLFRPICIWDY